MHTQQDILDELFFFNSEEFEIFILNLYSNIYIDEVYPEDCIDIALKESILQDLREEEYEYQY